MPGLSPANFERLSDFIRSQAGILMPHSKQTLLEGRLRRRIRETGHETLDDYTDWAFGEGRANGEMTHLINAVTTNKTDFFREPAHFDFIREVVLPDFLARGQQAVRVWSAACSTGAEPYTLAMVLDQFAETHGGPNFGLLATDIDTDVLETARRGVYPWQMLQDVPVALRQRYVLKASAPKRQEGRVIADLRAAVGFARLNLCDAAYPVGDPMDIIMCRNVLIYFDKATQRKVVSQLAQCLRPGGYLFLGHAESAAGEGVGLTALGNTVYQRP
ncbi:chemotaxis protein CheR [Novosphingobium sp. FSY-8]|uniref:Chemotaxis protein methyltransferase n=2 Tax=Novosphingobium ovatum TaxID=1908523 RepID=A0ABW9XA46_9SPHN|nr:chemotaxis protein CheR [Novosphingobium ovatum]